MKTIKQIADELGVDKQKVYRYIKRNHINETLQKNGMMYYDEVAETAILSAFSNKSSINEAPQNHFNDTATETVFNMLKRELEFKNKQLENLQSQILTLQAELSEERKHNREQADKLLVLTENAQKLHAGTIQQQLTVGETDTAKKETRADDEINPVITNQSWIKKLFKRNTNQ